MMTCRYCGKEILDNSLFCKFCGKKVDKEAAETLADTQTGEDFEEETKDTDKRTVEKPEEKKGGKADRKKLIICVSIAGVCIAAALVFVLVIGRSQGFTWNRFAKAYTKKARDKVLSLMIPESDEKAFERYLSDNNIDLGPHLDEYFGGKDLKSLKIAEKQSGDDELKKYFDLLLEDMNIKMEYSDVSLVKMSDNTEIFMYKAGGRWYILPDGMKLMTNLAAEQDAENGSHIASAIQTAISNEKVYDAMHAYGGVYFVLRDELPNLPQSFQDVIKEQVGEIPEVHNTRFGGQDFAVYLNISQNVIYVYVTSDNYLDEWVMYPNLDESYKTGDKGSGGEKVKPEAVQSELSYARLVDSNSSIAGYWQADGAGMYIGFDNFRGSDQFVIYSTFEDVVFPDAFDLNVGDKKIEGTGILNDESRIQFNIKDKDNIDVVYKSYNDEPELKFSFKRSDSGIGEEVFSRFQGNWVSEYGNDILELALDSNRGLIYDTKEDQSIFSGNFTCLYDGKNNLRYIFPYRGDIAEAYEMYEPFIGYDVFTYTLNGDELEYYYIDRGCRCVEGRTWYKEGSEGANVSKAIDAYDEVISDSMVDTVCNLAYLDDDNIPEFIYNNDMGAFEIMTYRNGELVRYYERLYNVASVQFIRTTSTGRIIIGTADDSAAYIFFKFENGEFEELGSCESGENYGSDEEDSMYYVVNGENVSQSEYQSFHESFGDFDEGSWISIIDAYTDVYEAYDALTGAE